MWIGPEIAIITCNLAEVVGSAIALKLLTGLPLVWGMIVTATNVFLLLLCSCHSIQIMEILVLAMMTVIFTCLAIDLVAAKPDSLAILKIMFVPSGKIVKDQQMLMLAVDILGATVMPHNLYLHSSVVQTQTPKAF